MGPSYGARTLRRRIFEERIRNYHFASSTSMRNGCCLCSFEKLPEGPSRRFSESFQSGLRYARSGGRARAKLLVCMRQRASQFPLQPYSGDVRSIPERLADEVRDGGQAQTEEEAAAAQTGPAGRIRTTDLRKFEYPCPPSAGYTRPFAANSLRIRIAMPISPLIHLRPNTS
jgi:hypothetical protein